MIEWLKAKWQYLALGVIVILAFLAGKGATFDEIRSALAFRKLKDLQRAQDAAGRSSTELDKKIDALATDILSEQIRVEAEKEKMHAAAPTAVDQFLRDRGAIK
jgi:hypothetical protein